MRLVDADALMMSLVNWWHSSFKEKETKDAKVIHMVMDKVEEYSQMFEVNAPSAQTENTDCIYCHEDSDGYVKPIEKNCHAFISFGMDGWELSLKANGWHGSTKIKYCPMCGRRLKR